MCKCFRSLFFSILFTGVFFACSNPVDPTSSGGGDDPVVAENPGSPDSVTAEFDNGNIERNRFAVEK